MKEIILTKGLTTTVDDADFDFLNKWKWYADKLGDTFYAKRRINLKREKGKPQRGTSIYMHREILELKKGEIGDHRDGNGLNNQRDNLRKCTHGQNMVNQKSQKNSSSKYLGVSWDSTREKWTVHVCKNYKVYSPGRFDNEKEAALAYNKKALELHGEFARLNDIGL